MMAVLDAYNEIVSHLDKGEHTAGIFLDLKSFDTISHEILATKLQHYGVRRNASDLLPRSVLFALYKT